MAVTTTHLPFTPLGTGADSSYQKRRSDGTATGDSGSYLLDNIKEPQIRADCHEALIVQMRRRKNVPANGAHPKRFRIRFRLFNLRGRRRRKRQTNRQDDRHVTAPLSHALSRDSISVQAVMTLQFQDNFWVRCLLCYAIFKIKYHDRKPSLLSTVGKRRV